MNIAKQLRAAVVLTLALCVVTGLLYPSLVTAAAQLIFPRQANGSLVEVSGRVVGSELVGQSFTQPWYFQGRPSAAGAGYDGSASSGTNKGPTDAKLAAAITERVDSAVAQTGVAKGAVPSDMVTASASGLDPHISPANARLQVARVAMARGADSAVIAALLERHVEGRQFGILGEARVNVLLLNIALDSLHPRPVAPADTTRAAGTATALRNP
jgi:potassium-transporting ATPase KdpC subunit